MFSSFFTWDKDTDLLRLRRIASMSRYCNVKFWKALFRAEDLPGKCILLFSYRNFSVTNSFRFGLFSKEYKKLIILNWLMKTLTMYVYKLILEINPLYNTRYLVFVHLICCHMRWSMQKNHFIFSFSISQSVLSVFFICIIFISEKNWLLSWEVNSWS